jgi:Dockerin type I domain
MRLRRILTILISITLLTTTAWGMADYTNKTQSSKTALILDTDTFLDINQLLCMIYNNGNFAYDNANFLGKTDGLYFPRGTTKTVIYAAGLWVGAKVNDSLRLATAEYSSEFGPGPMDGGTYLPDNASFRVYKIEKGNTSSNDYINWPADMGAPVDEFDDPAILGHQMCWSVFNDADTAYHEKGVGYIDPLGLEIQHTSFAFNRQDALGKVIFLKYLIINEGGNQLDDTYISLWCDPDLGGASDDLVGCDTNLSLGFCYNEAGTDNVYGDFPPAVGFDFLQGPIVDGDPSDSAYFMGEWIHGKKNLPMTSFNKYINGTDPHNDVEAYNYMQGFLPNGNPLIDNDGDTTKFHVAGDPVTGIGWLDDAAADRRFMMSSGPYTMMPGDTQEVVAAIIVGLGSDRLESISRLRENDVSAQYAYNNAFDIPDSPEYILLDGSGLDGVIELTWNDDVEDYYEDYLDPLGEFYVFEGYNIYQGESVDGPWKLLATFDMMAMESQSTFESVAGEFVINCITPDDCDTIPRPWNFAKIYDVIVNGTVDTIIVQNGNETGITNQLSITDDIIDGGPIVHHKPYYYGINSYMINIEDVRSEDSIFNGPTFAGFKAKYQESDIVPLIVIPDISDPLYTDTAEHVQGESDGLVLVDFKDSSALVPGLYTITFNEDNTWNLDRDGTPLLLNQTNQSGDFQYEVIDGIMVRVFGAPSGIKEIIETQNAFGPVDPPDNVFWSFNSTDEFYVSSDQSGSSDNARERFNWRNNIGIESWEFRFVEGNGSEYYNFNTDWLFYEQDGVTPSIAPFEVWHFTADAAEPDRRIIFAILDDEEPDGWSPGDRIYLAETEYSEPHPEYAPYIWDDDFHLGRVVFNSAFPEPGTVVRFNPTHPNTTDDIFQFIIGESYCGDLDNNAVVNITDAVFLINYIFTGGLAPAIPELANVNCDSKTNLVDIIYIINYVFRGGNDPCDISGDGQPDC